MMKTDDNKSTHVLKYNYIRRKVTFDPEHPTIGVKIRLKRFHIKGLECPYSIFRNFEFLRGKHTRCLNSLKIIGTGKWYLVLKNAKNLKKFTEIWIDIDSKREVSRIKSLPKSIEEISISGVLENFNIQPIAPFYRNLSCLVRLKAAQKSIEIVDQDPMLEHNYHQQEYKMVNQYMPRLRHLKRSQTFTFPERLMQGNQACAYITELSLVPSQNDPSEDNNPENPREAENEDLNESVGTPNESNQSENSMEDQENSESGGIEEDGLEEEDVNVDEQSEEGSSEMIYKLPCPFFRFHLFSNLRKLKLSFLEDFRYPQGSYVTEGFKSLKKLKFFDLEIKDLDNPKFTKPFYDDLLHLPLLTGLRLSIPFLTEGQGNSLTQFLQGQTQLVFFSLSIYWIGEGQIEYQEHNQFLQNIGKCLGNKPNLKYLTLASDSWNLESLSKGVQNTATLGQLQELIVRMFDDSLTCKLSADGRNEGLCDFMKRHKNSLRSLEISLQYVSKDEAVNNIIKDIYELKQLKKLSLLINPMASVVHYDTFFSTTYNLQRNPEDRLCFKQMLPHLVKTLRKLIVLSELKIEIYPLELGKRNIGEHFFGSYANSSTIFDSLLPMKGLKNLRLCLPFLKEALEKHPAQLLLLSQLETIMSLDIMTSCGFQTKELDEFVSNLKRKQILRSDLMFT